MFQVLSATMLSIWCCRWLKFCFRWRSKHPAPRVWSDEIGVHTNASRSQFRCWQMSTLKFFLLQTASSFLAFRSASAKSLSIVDACSHSTVRTLRDNLAPWIGIIVIIVQPPTSFVCVFEDFRGRLDLTETSFCVGKEFRDLGCREKPDAAIWCAPASVRSAESFAFARFSVAASPCLHPPARQ